MFAGINSRRVIYDIQFKKTGKIIDGLMTLCYVK